MTTERAVFSVREFCSFAGISRNTFYRLRTRGEGPAIVRIGRRVLVGRLVAAEWLQRRSG